MSWDLVGKAAAAVFLLKVSCSIWNLLRLYVFSKFGWRTNIKSYGKWAVVTGATDGIGKSYAIELARQGLKLVLISRSPEKLDSVKNEISELHDVEMKTIAFDYSNASGYEDIEKELEDLDIGILVNNVGVATGAGHTFLTAPVDQYQKCLNVNVLSLVKMTYMVLKGMLIRKKGIIVHVSSSSAYQPVPLFAVYCSTKAFVDFFARALQVEYGDKGIISQSLLPAFVATKMAKMKPSLFVPDPDTFVREAVQSIGIEGRTQGYWAHKIQGFIGWCLTPYVINKLIMSRYKARTKKKE